MNLYRYVITRDFGFAPNPYFGVCTLATCKPQIRSWAKIGDWIAGFGGVRTVASGKLVYIMKVKEKLKFDEYWNDLRFQCKKPNFYKSYKFYYGDNIYHHNLRDGNWLQENSHHSNGNEINNINLKKDTASNNVLISDEFWYFGSNACELPDEYKELVPHGRSISKEDNGETISKLVEWLKSKYNYGINGIPFSQSEHNGKFIRYNGVN